MHILVTGGLGFIGSHLCEALNAAGHRLTVLDDLSTGKRAHLVSGATLIEGDVSDDAAVRNAMEGADACFHLAAIASVDRARLEWLRCHTVNCAGTVNVFEAARARRIPVVYTSSAAVYGNLLTPPLTEDMRPQPASAYGADKLACELHGRVAAEVHGVPVAGLRLFNVYGPRQDPASPYSGVISIFAGGLAAGQPLTIHGDGLQQRDFIYVGDVVRAFLAAMQALTQRQIQQGVYNVCTGEPLTIRDLALRMAETLNITPNVRHGPPRAADIRNSFGDPSRAQAELGFAATTPLKQGLAETLTQLQAAA